MKSRKAIVPFDPKSPDKRINDFLYPRITGDNVTLVRTNNGEECKYGMVILKGGGINENDLFAKIVDGKTKITSVKTLLSMLEIYLEQIRTFSIGNIVYIERSDDHPGFVLKKYANRPTVERTSKLP
ncbi:hypothetical protein [Maribacter sp. 2-571]|uniref:hypothetical protein n=1 Tax=Maribacter sp. 2-571 TaxID=3417569 RepID=UPI003D33795D